jgi:hypothetical protein
MKKTIVSVPARIFTFLVLLAMIACLCTPVAVAQKGCMVLDIPAGPETGNFQTGIWYAEGPAFLGREPAYVKIFVRDSGGDPRGKKGNNFQGTETALYDFGKGDMFQTAISYVVVHNNDPSKFYLNAVEKIIPGSGTGRFLHATGTITTHGPFGISDWNTMDGWATFTSHGAVCGVIPAP